MQESIQNRNSDQPDTSADFPNELPTDTNVVTWQELENIYVRTSTGDSPPDYAIIVGDGWNDKIRRIFLRATPHKLEDATYINSKQRTINVGEAEGEFEFDYNLAEEISNEIHEFVIRSFNGAAIAKGRKYILEDLHKVANDEIYRDVEITPDGKMVYGDSSFDISQDISRFFKNSPVTYNMGLAEFYQEIGNQYANSAASIPANLHGDPVDNLKAEAVKSIDLVTSAISLLSKRRSLMTEAFMQQSGFSEYFALAAPEFLGKLAFNPKAVREIKKALSDNKRLLYLADEFSDYANLELLQRMRLDSETVKTGGYVYLEFLKSIGMQFEAAKANYPELYLRTKSPWDDEESEGHPNTDYILPHLKGAIEPYRTGVVKSEIQIDSDTDPFHSYLEAYDYNVSRMFMGADMEALQANFAEGENKAPFPIGCHLTLEEPFRLQIHFGGIITEEGPQMIIRMAFGDERCAGSGKDPVKQDLRNGFNQRAAN